MSKPLARRPSARRSVIDTTVPAPDIGRRLWEDEPGPVLVYAQLCTRDAAAAERLAEQAEERLASAPYAGNTEELPTVPVVLNAVLDTAVEWARSPAGRPVLAPALVEWAETGKARRQGGGDAPELPLAVRALRAMDAPDSELFWWARVEGLSDEVVARRLDRPVPGAAEDILRVTAEFRERARLAHTLQVQDPVCRSYAGLLEATARQGSGPTPPDLLGHLDQCRGCEDAFQCLSVQSPLLPQIVAGAALRWNGTVYVARRRRQLAQEPVGLIGRPAGPGSFPARSAGVLRTRRVWAAGVALVLLALTPLFLRDEPASQNGPPAPADPGEILPPVFATPSGSPQPGGSRAPGDEDTPGPSRTPVPPESSAEDEPSPDPGVSKSGPPPADEQSRAPACRAAFTLQDTWPDGVRGDLVVTTGPALGKGWKVTFRVPDDVSVETWYGQSTQAGDVVTVTAPSYERTQPAGATFTIGVVLRGQAYGAAWVSDVRVNGRVCGS
ncbi:cellulose binding domain-containing protein [Streptomyces sp. NPDC057301]|uniref:cellulose binding domain-containing protein n=1 Tax=Streptomyces sp. NPDC057301 TaxID=3346093 RepID=UPI0036404FA6